MSLQEREQVYQAAEKLVKLGSKSEVGLSAWHIAMERAYQDLVAICKKEKTTI